MNKDHNNLENSAMALAKLLEESKKETRYYQKIAKETGKRRLRETNLLSALISEQKRAEEALRKEYSFRNSIIEKAAEGLCVCHDIEKYPYVRFTVWNYRMVEITGYTMEEINRLGWYQSFYRDPETQSRAIERMAQMRQGLDLNNEEWEITRADGEKRILNISTSVLLSDNGITHVLALMNDQTDRKQAEVALQEAHDELEQKVYERTQALSMANEKMRQEIKDRRLAEDSLQEKEKELKDQADHLEEINTALKVLLEHRDEETTKLKEGIVLNVKKLVMPYLDKLDISVPPGHAKTYLDIVKRNLEDLVSPFASNLSSRQLNLTPAEIQVADFVRNGLTNKEIASHLNVSIDAVSFHRKNIRKKLGLTKRKTNLRSYLQRLSD